MLTNLVNMGGYSCGLAVWLSYSVLNRRSAAVPILVPQRWDQALTDLRPQTETESLIPMFEHMVDQAFSKVQGSRV